MTQSIRELEQRQLRARAKKEGLLLSDAEFEQRWIAQGRLGESEHDIYFENGMVFKRQVAERALAFSTYFGYFNRLILFDYFFPEAPYDLQGFVEHEGILMPIVCQPEVYDVADTPLLQVEIDQWMDLSGFRKIGETSYLTPDGRIEVSDMHDENVLRTAKGRIVVIDNDINIRLPD